MLISNTLVSLDPKLTAQDDFLSALYILMTSDDILIFPTALQAIIVHYLSLSIRNESIIYRNENLVFTGSFRKQ